MGQKLYVLYKEPYQKPPLEEICESDIICGLGVPYTRDMEHLLKNSSVVFSLSDGVEQLYH